MKVGILTYHRAYNYGAFLQAYGLCELLNQESLIDAEIIDFHMAKEVNMHRKFKLSKLINIKEFIFLNRLHNVFKKSIDKLKLSDKYLCCNSIEKFNNFVMNKYDVIIVGSDEVFKLDGFRGFPNPYWLIGNLGCKKVSYAASSRCDLKDFSQNVVKQIKGYLSDFSYISVRDDITCNQFKKMNKNIFVMPDPSFVYDYDINVNVGKRILYNNCANSSKKVALVMIENDFIAQKIRMIFKDKYELVSVFHYHKGFVNICDLNPFDWLNVMSSVDFVFASYFHAICFSIKNNISFLTIGTLSKKDKLYDLLVRSDNLNRYISCDDFLKNDSLIDYVNNLNCKCDNSRYLKECKENFKDFIDILKNL